MKKLTWLTFWMVFVLLSNSVFAAALKWQSEADDRMNWQSARDYCEKSNGRLPTTVELLAEVSACGGKTTGDYYPQENEINEKYQSCLQGKGWQGDYWSATVPPQSRVCADDVYMRTGGTGCGHKEESFLKVRCISR